MIVVDTSALIAIFRGEPEAESFLQLIFSTPAIISAPSRLEAFVVVTRRYGDGKAAELGNLIADLQLTTVAFDETLAGLAEVAFKTYRRGRHGLNYGDCFSYALAKSRDLPLLFKGEDFAATDVKRAV
ncbi:VapC toxin family PIN domain ribonuclease [Caulobacter sp. B11]|uniref:type II toxin-antitoxin system VapC family toxin n=1 Tax=Caulobacter sp. B11 TaxID=2048899 RepID=UPI000C12CD3A|nr:type II toxin-antitoxin system VapC family toxin [Caulobacter sp. B11]PHY13021.1 VapC toxin family PIN domain ribonuclease [Caulobacter sp. B11]